jgi:hypothetical protein
MRKSGAVEILTLTYTRSGSWRRREGEEHVLKGRSLQTYNSRHMWLIRKAVMKCIAVLAMCVWGGVLGEGRKED